MKLLLVSGIYPPDIGGPASSIPRFAKFLQNHGNTVEVLTLKDSKRSPVKHPWLVNYVARDQFLFFRILKTVIFITKKLKNIDAVYVNGLIQESAFAIKIKSYSKNSVVKLVSDPVWERAVNKNETTLGVIDFNKSNLRFKHWCQRVILVWSLNQFHQVICPSEQLLGIIKGWKVKTPVTLILNGVSITENRPAEKRFDLITVCRLIPLKNCNLMIDACKEIGATLAIVGSGPDENYLRKLAGDYNEIKFFGDQSFEEILDLLNSSRIYMNLSSHEGLSYALLEAMSCGLPSIVSNIEGNKAVIKDMQEGLIVNYNDAYQIRSAIVMLLESKSLRESCGKAAKDKVQGFYSDNVQFKKIYDLLLEIS